MIFTAISAMADAAVKEGFIEVTGGKVWYRVEGIEASGIPLLVVHGGPGAPANYLQNIGELANERPVIFYDQLGCGKSERPQDPNLWKVSRFTEELHILRQALNLEELHLMGQSWGTMLCVEYIKAYGSQGIHSLVLSAPYLNTDIWAKDQRKLISNLDEKSRQAIAVCEAEGDYAAQAYQDAMMSFYQKHLCRMDPWPESMLQTMENMGMDCYMQMWGPSEFTITGSLIDADVTSFLPKLGVPVLYTCGEYDEATPQSTRYFAGLTPHSELKIFAGASHQHHIEQQAEYNALLRKFLAAQEE